MENYEEDKNLSWLAIAIVCRNKADIVAMVIEGVGLGFQCLFRIHVGNLESPGSSILDTY